MLSYKEEHWGPKKIRILPAESRLRSSEEQKLLSEGLREPGKSQSPALLNYTCFLSKDAVV